jgi:hypothetical protein
VQHIPPGANIGKPPTTGSAPPIAAPPPAVAPQKPPYAGGYSEDLWNRIKNLPDKPIREWKPSKPWLSKFISTIKDIPKYDFGNAGLEPQGQPIPGTDSVYRNTVIVGVCFQYHKYN